MNREKVEQAVRLMMEGLDLDLTQEGLLDTPRRVSSMFIDDFFRDMNRDPSEVLTTFFHADYDEMVALRNIQFHSVCEHHLLPFIGKAIQPPAAPRAHDLTVGRCIYGKTEASWRIGTPGSPAPVYDASRDTETGNYDGDDSDPWVIQN